MSDQEEIQAIIASGDLCPLCISMDDPRQCPDRPEADA